MQDTPDSVRALILRYFNSWQEPTDLYDMRKCLDDAVESDVGFVQMTGADKLIAMIDTSGTPWKQVTLIESIFTENAGALFYEGVAVSDGKKTRVGEHISVKNGKIVRITASICALG